MELQFFGFLRQNAEIWGMDPIVLVLQLILIVSGLALSAFLTGSEVALFALASRNEKLDQNSKIDQRILSLLENPERLRALFSLAINFTNLSVAIIAAHIAGNYISFFGGSQFWILVSEVIVFAFLILVLSTITPKITAINNPLKLSRRNSGVIRLFAFLLTPIAIVLVEINQGLEKVFPKSSPKMTSEDIRTMAEDHDDEQESMKDDEREIIENVIEFGNITVREIMTSRVNIVAVSVEDSLQEVLKKIREKALSRMPLYENDLDNIIGILYAKDVLAYLDTDEDEPSLNWKTTSRKALFIPDSKRLDDLLKDFQQEKTHIAVVVDEYGGTEGIVTMDDILEEIVGDISDDVGDEATLYTQFKSGIYIFDAKITLDDMEEILNCEISNEDDEFETLGGLIYHLIENLPTVGERIKYKNLELTVHSVKNNRIKKVRVKVDGKEETSLSN